MPVTMDGRMRRRPWFRVTKPVRHRYPAAADRAAAGWTPGPPLHFRRKPPTALNSRIDFAAAGRYHAEA
ncbi:MAG: hypothetical protein COS34_01045 [Lysobacterales bacterium CG02_land_8_20_14_3_00_62_12]|nr:MAG: hypothetical protein COS34_01045 [Xanthomonadales bacterium CG02_land_8_20_14_3_00_62_12]